MLGRAAVVIWCDVPRAQRREWEEWHSQEHMPERLGIPGFLRGTRWVAQSGRPSYFMLYETRDLKTTTRGAYLRRLNNPTPWSRRMMLHHHNMARGVCKVQWSAGGLLARSLATIRFSGPMKKTKAGKGITGFHLLAARAGRMTAEQKIRGRDAAVDRVLLIAGYSDAAVRAAARAYRRRGAVTGFYRPAYSLVSRES